MEISLGLDVVMNKPEGVDGSRPMTLSYPSSKIVMRYGGSRSRIGAMAAAKDGPRQFFRGVLLTVY